MTRAAIPHESVAAGPLWLLFGVFLAIPSLAMLERLFSVVAERWELPAWGFFLLAGAYLLVLMLVARRFFRLLAGWPERTAIWLAIGSWVGLLLAFLFIYPLADSGQLGFVSDRDEALDVAVRRLLDGKYPYHCRAVAGVHYGCPEQGNAIAPMPGALFLNIPFVLLGGSAAANLGWLVAFFILLRQVFAGASRPVAYVLTLFFFAPVLGAEVLTGGDHLANSLAVTVALLGLLHYRPVPAAVLWGILLGLALSWRAHFLLMGVPLLAFYVRQGFPRHLLIGGLVTVLAWLAVTIPFWWHDPDGFTPWQVQQKLDRFAAILPAASWLPVLLAAVTGLVMGGLAHTTGEVLIACGVTVSIPLLFAIGFHSWESGYLTFMFYGWYVLTPAIPLTLGVVLHLSGQQEEGRSALRQKTSVRES